MTGSGPAAAGRRPTPRWTDRADGERADVERPDADADADPRSADPRDPARSSSRFVQLYRARPWHLLTLLALFVVTGYAASRLLMNPAWLQVAIWFVGAAVVWDLVVGPLYVLADRVLRGVLPAVRGISLLNHVRAPAVVSSLLLLMFAPLIFQRTDEIFALKAGLPADPYLSRWLLLTVGLFAASALVFGLRVLRAGGRGRAPASSAGPSGD